MKKLLVLDAFGTFDCWADRLTDEISQTVYDVNAWTPKPKYFLIVAVVVITKDLCDY